MSQALSARTLATYATGIRTFKIFCAMHNLSSDIGPPREPGEQLFIYFVCHCNTALKVGYTTIKSYLAGIRNFYIQQGLGNKFVHSNGQPMLSLDLVLRGIRKQPKGPRNKRLPITVGILLRLHKVLNGRVFGKYTDSLMKAVCSLAFFGFMRCGEFTTLTNTFQTEVHLCLGDLILEHKQGKIHTMKLNLKVSKTDPFREGCSISYHCVDSPVCAVRAMESYLIRRLNLTRDSCSPLFLFPGGQALTRNTFLAMLTTACTQAGLNPSGFSGHSFRRGAATTAAQQKIPDHLLRTLGRWSSNSNCYQTYIDTSQNDIAWAQRTMSSL